ncbi:MAG: lysophospholipid acyltransferase family protein [Alphaproteobacteria bacterium]
MIRLRGLGKRLSRAVTRSEGVRAALCRVASLYIRFVHLTSRWEVEGGEVPRDRWEKNQPFILALWHGRMLMMPYAWDLAKPIHMLASHHRDGQLIGVVISHFGVGTIAGSTSKGGAEALRAMVRMLRGGGWIGITPDGPRGPRMRASAGVAMVAKLSGLPIIPAAYSTARGRTLGSWDRFLLALPFSRGVFVWGRPIEVPRDADAAALEGCRKALEDELNAITAAADRRMGRAPVEPAEG